MNLLTMENVSKSFTERMLFDSINLGINDNDRIGVIGINGTGKSTLLKIIAGLEEPDSGTITKGKKVRIEYLPQTPVFDSAKSILENVTEGKKADEEYINLEGAARTMLAKLGITDCDSTPQHLSGGQRKRMALVRTLLTSADILVLDEPTNHLDNEMAEWLQDYLMKYRGAFIMITHDRYFLDKVTNRIVELDKSKLYSYTANYSRFLELKAEREEMELATERKNKSLYRMELEWMMRGARARSTKQKAHIQRFEELRDRKKIETDGKVEMSSLSSRLGKKTIEIDHISKRFGDRTLIEDFSYIFLPGDRIGIIGANGCGKSTLLKMITGKLLPDSGTIEIGQTVKIGYFSQENEYMDQNLKVLDYIRETADFIQTTDGTVTASAMCERFLFTSSMQYTQIAKLSGGEKRRLYLLKVLMEAPNILILDEPTNDLDIATLTILEDYLTSFDGIVITVSHDRYFLDKIAERIFSFEGNGVIRQYEGNFSDYKEASARRAETEAPVASTPKESLEAPAASKATWKQPSNKPKFSYKEQKEFETIDADIASLEEKIEEMEEKIAASATEYSKLNEYMAEKERLEAALAEKMDRWVYLTELAEQIEAAKKA
ncbi:MAG: ABC-F family ATP-binding cassette domain-containing protein [Lachnospiraceae bacterium]|nr:ABC-F family ATP-binding cassette domain-containing protein [Lachnospiraceae bacterium]